MCSLNCFDIVKEIWKIIASVDKTPESIQRQVPTSSASVAKVLVYYFCVNRTFHFRFLLPEGPQDRFDSLSHYSVLTCLISPNKLPRAWQLTSFVRHIPSKKMSTARNVSQMKRDFPLIFITRAIRIYQKFRLWLMHEIAITFNFERTVFAFFALSFPVFGERVIGGSGVETLVTSL